MAHLPTRRLILCALAAVLTACGGDLSALRPLGPVADTIAGIWWVMFWGAAGVFALVMGLVCYAMFRAPERRMRVNPTVFIAVGGLAFPTVVLTALLVYGTAAGQRITAPVDDALIVEVTGHQWWWEFRYPATDDAPEVVTANELHLPVGVPVQLSLESADVIHSFWVPNLAGKIDLVPGRTNVLRLQADVEARYFGQCAEFCGAQHAHMKFTVTAESPDAFAAWRRARAREAAVTDGPGLDAFMASGCAECHALRGTAADGTAGPDLTHVGARPTLGAATLVNDADGIRAWLARHGWDVKRGNRGPDLDGMDPELTEELARFLEAQR